MHKLYAQAANELSKVRLENAALRAEVERLKNAYIDACNAESNLRTEVKALTSECETFQRSNMDFAARVFKAESDLAAAVEVLRNAPIKRLDDDAHGFLVRYKGWHRTSRALLARLEVKK